MTSSLQRPPVTTVLNLSLSILNRARRRCFPSFAGEDFRWDDGDGYFYVEMIAGRFHVHHYPCTNYARGGGVA